ncbi:MAG: hypothetical protein ABIP33_06285 [Pseudolysinimonas sp.]
MIATAAECDFCPNTLEIDTAAGLTHNDIAGIRRNPELLEPGWRSITIDDHELIVFCPRCAVIFATAASAIAAGVDQVLEQRRTTKAIA